MYFASYRSHYFLPLTPDYPSLNFYLRGTCFWILRSFAQHLDFQNMDNPYNSAGYGQPSPRSSSFGYDCYETAAEDPQQYSPTSSSSWGSTDASGSSSSSMSTTAAQTPWVAEPHVVCIVTSFLSHSFHIVQF